MPHVSKYRLDKKQEEKLFLALVDNLAFQRSKRGQLALYKEVLTRTEQLMLAKRLALISMLGEGISFEEIQRTLKVSSSTVTRFWLAMQQGRFKETVRVVRKPDVSQKILNLLGSMLVPRPRHAPRWKWMDELYP